MDFQELLKTEKEYSSWLRQQPFVDSTKVQKNEEGKWVLWVCYKTGMTITQKRKIATELGGVPMKFFEIKDVA